jgi:hypothetical protein
MTPTSIASITNIILTRTIRMRETRAIGTRKTLV